MSVWSNICKFLAYHWHSWMKPIVINVGKILLAQLGKELLDFIKALVKAMEHDASLSGSEKREKVVMEARSWLAEKGEDDVPSYLLNLAIEVFLTEFRSIAS